MSKQFVPVATAEIEWRENLPFSVLYQDIYHSRDSAIGQSQYVFIEGNNLVARFNALSPASSFTIGETGFGCGLNFLITWQLWQQHAPQGACLHYISCEKNPLSLDCLKRVLANWPTLSEYSSKLIDQYPVLIPGHHHLHFANGTIKLTLMLGDAFTCFEQLLICGDSTFESRLRTRSVDAWFLDGFSPKKNEAMWSDKLIATIAMLSSSGTSLASYTVASLVKRTLANYGFNLLKKKGYGPKRHMICATFLPVKEHRLSQRHTPWHVGPPLKVKDKSALIVGAGLAGCMLANTLARRGWQITLIDEKRHSAMGASAVEQAVLFPKLSAYRSPLTELMLHAFLYAHNYYHSLIELEPHFGVLKGSILLAMNDKERQAQHGMLPWLASYPELGRLLNAENLSLLAGIELNHSGLYIPLSGWMNTPTLCAYLVEHKNITVETNVCVTSLERAGDYWLLANHRAEVVVLANSYKAKQFTQTNYLPLRCIRGQLTKIQANAKSKGLLLPVCGEGHILPESQGAHLIGATYDLGATDPIIKPHDDDINLKKLKNVFPHHEFSEQIISNWCGIRASTPDYLPLVGPVAKADDFLASFAGLGSNSNRWIPTEGAYYPSLYLFAGFGPRGLTTIPLCAEWLSACINNEVSGAPRHIMQSLSPARFLRRHIIRKKV